MEPLTEENKKLKEAMNRSEKNIQRAQRERDLAESNARDLEYQKGVLSEHLATAKEQLQSKPVAHLGRDQRLGLLRREQKRK